MIHEEICTYEVAKLAKEKGFPQHIGDDAYIVENEYDNEYEVGCCYPIQFIPDYLPTITAPTQSLLQRWLREGKNIHIEISVSVNDKHCFYWTLYSKGCECWEGAGMCYGEYSTYELALEDALAYSLKNLV